MANFESTLGQSESRYERSIASALVDMSREHAEIRPPHSRRERGNSDRQSLVVSPISTIMSDVHSPNSDPSQQDPLIETTSPWAQHAYLRAKEVMPPDQFDEFKTMMNGFAARNESSSEVDGTYQQISRLLDATGGAIPQDQRIDAAVGILEHAVHPDSVGQGNNDTCTLASLETREYTRSPAKAAEIVATAALTGQWTAPDGKQIKLDPNGLQLNADDEGAIAGFNRDEASRVFQVTMVNDITQRQSTPIYFSGGTGEELTYANGRVANMGGEHQLLGLPPSEVAKLAQRDFGDGNFFLINQQMVKADKLNPAGLTEFQSPSTLQWDLQHGGGFPYEIALNGQKLFGALGTPNHAIRLLREDPSNGDVTVSDPNLPRLTEGFTINQLYQASQ
jgi:hypothetical protein